MNRPAIFLDRDGVLNSMVLNPGTGQMESPLTPADFHLFDGVIPALRRLQNAGYLLILVSNQPNYALGKTSYETHKEIHQNLVHALVSAEIHFVRFSYCLHHPEASRPAIRMCVNAASHRRVSFCRLGTILVSPSPIPG